MSKATEKVLAVLLILSTAANVVTAAMLVKVAREGFDVEITMDEAKKAIEAAEAAEVAVEDIEASEVVSE